MLHTCADLELFFDEVNRLTMQLLMHTPSKTIGLDSRYVFPFRSNPTFVKAIAALCERAGPNYQQIVTYLFKILPYADMELDVYIKSNSLFRGLRGTNIAQSSWIVLYYTISHCIMDALAALTDMTYFQWLDNDSQLLIRDAIFRFLKPTNPYFTVKGMYDPSIELYAQRCEEELALQMGGILNQVLTSFNINEPVEFPLQYAKHVCDSLGSIKLNEKEGPRIQDSFPSKIIISSTKVLWNLIDTLDTAKVTKAFMHVTNECLRCPNLNTPWFSFFLLAAANFYGRCARPDAAADQEQNNLLSSLLGNLDKHSTSQSYWIFLACTICNLNPRLYSDHMDNFSTQVLKYALKSARGPISQQVTSLVALQNNTATAATTAPTKNPQPVVFTTIPRNEASTVEAGPRSGEDFRIDGANPSGQGSLFLYAPSLKGDRSNGGGFIRFEPDSEYTRGIENIYALDALTIALLGVPPFDPYPWVAVRAGTEGFTMPANFSLFNSQDSLSHRMFARKKDFVVNRKVLQKINDTLFLKKNTELPFYLLTVQPAARLVAAMSLHNLSYMDSTVFQPILATRTKFKRMQNIMLRVLRYMLLPSFGWFDSWAENMGHKVLLGEYESLNRKKQGTDTKTGFVAETAFWATGKETGDKLKLESAADSLSTISGANQVLIQAKNDTTITNRFADPIFTSTTNSHARAIFEGFLSTSILPLIQSLERKCESEVGSTKGGLASVEPSSSEIASVFTLLPKVRSSDDDSFDIDVHRVKMSDLPNTNAEVSSNFASSNPISLASPWDLSSSWYKASFLQRGAMSPSFVPDTIGLSQPLRFIQPTTDDPYMGDVPPFYASHLFTPSMSNSIFAVGEAQATRDELGAFPHTTLFDLPQLSKTRSRQIFHIGDQLESEWVKKKKTRLETDPPFQQELITNIQTGAGIIDLETSLTSTLASRVEREARVWASFKHYHLMVKREATRPKDTSIDGVKKRVIAHNNKFHVRPNPLHITNRTPLSATTDTSFSVQSEKRRLDGMKTSLEYEGGRLVRRSGLEVVNVLLDGSDLIIADEDERVGVSEVRGQIPKNAINLDDEDEADYDPSEALFGVDGLWSNAPDPLNGKPNTLDVVSGRTQFDVRIDGKKVKAGAEYRPAPSAMSHESMRVVLQSDVIVVEKEAVDVEPPDPNEQGITDEEKKKRKKDHREWVDRQEVLERRKKDPRHLKLYKDIRKLRDKEYDIDIATHRSRPAVTEMSPEEEIGYIRHRLSGNEDSPAADLLAILIYERARELEFPNLEKTMTPATAKALKPSFFTSDSKLYQSPLFTHSITTLWSVITKERGLPSVASVMMNSNAPQDNKDNPVILPNSTQSRSVFNSFRMDTLNAIACSSDLACTSTSNEEYAQVAMMGTSEAYAVLGQIAAQFRLNANRAHAPSLPGVKDIKDPRGKYSQYDPRLAFVMDLFEDKTLTFLRINPTNGTSRNEYDVLDDAFSSYLSTQVSSLPLILPDPPHLSPTPCITRPFTSLMAARTPYLYPLVVKQNKVLYYSLQQTIAEITPYFGLYAPESALKTFTSPGYLRLVLHRHAPIAVAASLALQRSMSLLPLHRASIVLSVVREIQDLPQTLSTFYSITFQDSRKADVQTLENDPFFTSRPQLSVGDAGLGLLPVTQGTTPLRFIHSNEHVVMTMANLLLLLVQQWDRSLVCELAALNARSAAVFSIPFGKPSSTRFVDLNAGQVKQHVPDLKKKDDKVKLPGAPAAPKSQEPESYNLFADFTGNETFTTSDLMTPLSGTSITTRQHMDTLLQVCQTLDGVSMFLLGHGSPSVRAIVLRLVRQVHLLVESGLALYSSSHHVQTSHLKRRITQIEADLDFLLSNKQKGQVGQGQKSNADELINQNSHVYRQMLRNLKRLLLEATTEQDPIVVRPTLYEIISGRRLSLEGQLYTGDNLWKRKQATEPQTSKFTPFAPSSVSIPHGISAQSMYELPKSSTLVATLESGRPRVGSSVSDKRSAILGTHVYNLKTDVGRDHPSFLQEMLQIGGRDATVAEQMALYPDGYAPVLLYTPLSAKWISDFVARRASVKAITPSAGSTWVNLLPCLRAPLAPSEMIPDEPNLSSSGGYVYDNDYNIFSLLQSRAETRLASITSFSLLGALRSAQQLPLRALGRPLVAKAFKSLIQTVASAPDTSTLNTGNPDGAKKPSELIQLLISNGTGRPESKLPNAPFDPVQTTPSMLWVLSVLGGLDHQYARWSAELLASDTDVTHPKAFQREIEKEQERLKDLAVDCTSASISEAMNKDDQAVADRMRNALRQTNLGNRVARLADRVVNQVRDAAQNIAGDEANERDKQRNSLEQYVSLHLTSLQDLFANRHSLETLWTSLLGQITHQYGASGSTVGIRAFHHTAAWFYKSVHRIPENYPSAIKMDTAFECGFREMVGNTLVGTLALGPVSSADMSTEQFLKERKENVKLKMKTDTEAQPSRTETTDQDPEQANSSFEETKSTLYSPAENPVFLDGFNLILKQVLPQVFSTLGSTFMSLQYAGMIALSNLHPHLILDTLNAFETWTKTAFPSMEVLKKEFSNIKGDDEGQRLANKKEQQKFIRAKFSPVQYINLSNLIPRFLRIIAENDSFSLALSLNPAPIMRYYMSLCAAVIEFPLLRNGKPRIPAFGDYLLPLTQRSKGQRNMAGRSVKTIPGDMDINDLIIRNSTEQNIDEYDELMRKLDAGEEEDDTLGDVPNFTTGLQSADFDVPEANLPFIGPYYQTMFMGKGMLSHVFPQYGKSLMSKPNPKLEEQVNRSMNVVVTHFTKGQANEIDLKIVDGNRHKVTLLLTTQLGRPSNPLDYVMRAVDSMGALSALARALSVGFLPPEELRINPPLPIIATAETVNEFSVSCGLVPSIFLTTASLEQLMSNHLKDIHLYSSTKPDTVPEDQFSKNIHNLYSLHASLMSRWMWRTNLASTGDLYGHPFQYLSLSAPQQSLIGADAQLADALLTSAPSIIRGSLRSAVSDGVSHVISQFVETHECAEENNTAARFIPYNPAPVSIHPASADLSGLSYVSTGSGAAATLPQRSLDNPSQIDITSVDRINQTPANALADSLLFMSGKSKDDVPPATLPSVMSVIVQSHLDSVPMASLSKGLLRALLLFPVAYRIELLRLAMNHAAYGEFSVPMNIVTSVGANRLELYLNEKYENEKAQYVPYFNTEEGVNQAKRAAPALFNYGMNPYTASPGKNFVYRQGGAYGRPWMKSGYKTLLQLRTVFSPLSIVDNFWHYTLALSGHGHAAVSYLIRLLDPRLQDIMKNNRLVPRIEYLSMQKAPEAPASIHGESGGSHLKFSNEDEDEMEDMAPEKLRTDRGYENEWKIDAAALGKENRKESKKLKQLKAAEEDQTKQTLVPQSGSPLAKMARSPKRQNQNQSSGAINITTVPTNDLVIGMEPLFPSIVNQIEQQFYGVQTAGKKPQVKTTSSIKESLPPYAPLLISEKSITFYALAEAHQNRLVEIRSKAGTVLPKAPQLSFLLGNSYPDRAQPPAILTDPDTEIVMPNQLTWEDVKKPKVSADELIQVTDPSLFSHSFGAASSVRSLPFILQVLLFYPQHVSIHILSRCFSDESSIASLFKIAIMKFFTSARFDPVSLRNLDLTPGLILPSINELSKRNKQLYSSVLSFALSNLISSIPSIRLASVQLIRAIVRFQLSEYEQEELLLVYQRMKAKEMNDVSSRRPGAAKPGNPLSGSGDPSMQKLSDSDYYTQKCASLLMVLSLLNHHTPSLANAYSVESLYQSGQAISDSVFRAFPDLLLPVVQASFTNLTQISSNLPLHTSGTLSITDRAPASLFYAENNSEVWNMHPLFISQPSPLEFTSDLARLIVTYDTTFSQSHSLLRLIAPWAEHTDLLATSPDERVQFLQVMFGLVQIWIQKRERQSTGPAALPGIVAPFSSRSIRKFPALPTLSRATIAENDPLLKEAISIWERMAASTSTIENANQRVSRQSLGQGNLMSNLAALEGGDSTLNPIAVPQTNAPIASLTTSQPMSISNNLPVPPNVQLVVRAVLSQIFKTIGTGSTLPAFHILHALFSSYPKVVMNDISLLLTPALWKSLVGVQHAFLIATKRAHATEIDPKTSDKPQGPRHRRLQSSLSKSQRGTDVPSISGVPEGDLERKQRSQIRHVLSQSSIQLKQAGFGRIVVAHILGSIASKNPSIIEEYIPILLAFAVVHSASTQSVIVKKAYGRNYQEQKTKGSKLPLIDARKTHNGLNKHFAEDPSEATTLTSPSAVIKVFLVRLIEVILLLRDSQPQSYFIPVPEGKGDEPADVASDPPSKKEKPRFSDNYPSSFRYGEWQARQNFKEMLPLFSQSATPSQADVPASESWPINWDWVDEPLHPDLLTENPPERDAKRYAELNVADEGHEVHETTMTHNRTEGMPLHVFIHHIVHILLILSPLALPTFTHTIAEWATVGGSQSTCIAAIECYRALIVSITRLSTLYPTMLCLPSSHLASVLGTSLTVKEKPMPPVLSKQAMEGPYAKFVSPNNPNGAVPTSLSSPLSAIRLVDLSSIFSLLSSSLCVPGGSQYPQTPLVRTATHGNILEMSVEQSRLSPAAATNSEQNLIETALSVQRFSTSLSDLGVAEAEISLPTYSAPLPIWNSQHVSAAIISLLDTTLRTGILHHEAHGVTKTDLKTAGVGTVSATQKQLALSSSLPSMIVEEIAQTHANYRRFNPKKASPTPFGATVFDGVTKISKIPPGWTDIETDSSWAKDTNNLSTFLDTHKVVPPREYLLKQVSLPALTNTLEIGIIRAPFLMLPFSAVTPVPTAKIRNRSTVPVYTQAINSISNILMMFQLSSARLDALVQNSNADYTAPKGQKTAVPSLIPNKANFLTWMGDVDRNTYLDQLTADSGFLPLFAMDRTLNNRIKTVMKSPYSVTDEVIEQYMLTFSPSTGSKQQETHQFHQLLAPSPRGHSEGSVNFLQDRAAASFLSSAGSSQILLALQTAGIDPHRVRKAFPKGAVPNLFTPGTHPFASSSASNEILETFVAAASDVSSMSQTEDGTTKAIALKESLVKTALEKNPKISAFLSSSSSTNRPTHEALFASYLSAMSPVTPAEFPGLLPLILRGLKYKPRLLSAVGGPSLLSLSEAYPTLTSGSSANEAGSTLNKLMMEFIPSYSDHACQGSYGHSSSSTYLRASPSQLSLQTLILLLDPEIEDTFILNAKRPEVKQTSLKDRWTNRADIILSIFLTILPTIHASIARDYHIEVTNQSHQRAAVPVNKVSVNDTPLITNEVTNQIPLARPLPEKPTRIFTAQIFAEQPYAVAQKWAFLFSSPVFQAYLLHSINSGGSLPGSSPNSAWPRKTFVALLLTEIYKIIAYDETDRGGQSDERILPNELVISLHKLIPALLYTLSSHANPSVFLVHVCNALAPSITRAIITADQLPAELVNNSLKSSILSNFSFASGDNKSKIVPPLFFFLPLTQLFDASPLLFGASALLFSSTLLSILPDSARKSHFISETLSPLALRAHMFASPSMAISSVGTDGTPNVDSAVIALSSLHSGMFPLHSESQSSFHILQATSAPLRARLEKASMELCSVYSTLSQADQYTAPIAQVISLLAKYLSQPSFAIERVQAPAASPSPSVTPTNDQAVIKQEKVEDQSYLKQILSQISGILAKQTPSLTTLSVFFSPMITTSTASGSVPVSINSTSRLPTSFSFGADVLVRNTAELTRTTQTVFMMYFTEFFSPIPLFNQNEKRFGQLVQALPKESLPKCLSYQPPASDSINSFLFAFPSAANELRAGLSVPPLLINTLPTTEFCTIATFLFGTRLATLPFFLKQSTVTASERKCEDIEQLVYTAFSSTVFPGVSLDSGILTKREQGWLTSVTSVPIFDEEAAQMKLRQNAMDEGEKLAESFVERETPVNEHSQLLDGKRAILSEWQVKHKTRTKEFNEQLAEYADQAITREKQKNDALIKKEETEMQRKKELEEVDAAGAEISEKEEKLKGEILLNKEAETEAIEETEKTRQSIQQLKEDVQVRTKVLKGAESSLNNPLKEVKPTQTFSAKQNPLEILSLLVGGNAPGTNGIIRDQTDMERERKMLLQFVEIAKAIDKTRLEALFSMHWSKVKEMKKESELIKELRVWMSADKQVPRTVLPLDLTNYAYSTMIMSVAQPLDVKVSTIRIRDIQRFALSHAVPTPIALNILDRIFSDPQRATPEFLLFSEKIANSTEALLCLISIIHFGALVKMRSKRTELFNQTLTKAAQLILAVFFNPDAETNPHHSAFALKWLKNTRLTKHAKNMFIRAVNAGILTSSSDPLPIPEDFCKETPPTHVGLLKEWNITIPQRQAPQVKDASDDTLFQIFAPAVHILFTSIRAHLLPLFVGSQGFRRMIKYDQRNGRYTKLNQPFVLSAATSALTTLLMAEDDPKPPKTQPVWITGQQTGMLQ